MAVAETVDTGTTLALPSILDLYDLQNARLSRLMLVRSGPGVLRFGTSSPTVPLAPTCGATFACLKGVQFQIASERTNFVEQVNTQTGKGRTKALWAAVAIIAVAAAGVIGGKAFYEAKVSELVARTGATARSVEVDFLGQIHIRELALPLADGKNIRIAAIDGRPKFPFLDGALELNDINVDVPSGKISMAHARVENAAFTKPDAAEVSGDGNANSLPKRIERFAA